MRLIKAGAYQALGGAPIVEVALSQRNIEELAAGRRLEKVTEDNRVLIVHPEEEPLGVVTVTEDREE